ncbi:MAG: hypothetical protein FWE18_00035 [Alphaproteobacteria bacterium]|nr:hypothetical protein [Alphaproteobacteria bacterium]
MHFECLLVVAILLAKILEDNMKTKDKIQTIMNEYGVSTATAFRYLKNGIPQKKLSNTIKTDSQKNDSKLLSNDSDSKNNYQNMIAIDSEKMIVNDSNYLIVIKEVKSLRKQVEASNNTINELKTLIVNLIANDSKKDSQSLSNDSIFTIKRGIGGSLSSLESINNTNDSDSILDSRDSSLVLESESKDQDVEERKEKQEKEKKEASLDFQGFESESKENQEIKASFQNQSENNKQSDLEQIHRRLQNKGRRGWAWQNEAEINSATQNDSNKNPAISILEITQVDGEKIAHTTQEVISQQGKNLVGISKMENTTSGNYSQNGNSSSIEIVLEVESSSIKTSKRKARKTGFDSEEDRLAYEYVRNNYPETANESKEKVCQSHWFKLTNLQKQGAIDKMPLVQAKYEHTASKFIPKFSNFLWEKKWEEITERGVELSRKSDVPFAYRGSLLNDISTADYLAEEARKVNERLSKY